MKYICGHESSGIFVNPCSGVYAFHRVWIEKKGKKECFSCFCKKEALS